MKKKEEYVEICGGETVMSLKEVEELAKRAENDNDS